MKRTNLETYDFTWTDEIENENGEWIEIERTATLHFSFSIDQAEFENGYAYYDGGVEITIWETEGDAMDKWTEMDAEEEIGKMIFEEYC